MRVTAVELSRLELELVHPLETSAARYATRPLLVVKVITESVSGIGECSALATPTYTSEYADGAEAMLGEFLLPLLLEGGAFATVPEAMARLERVRGHEMAKSSIEMALLDAELRAAGRSLASFLGEGADRIPAGGSVSLGTPDSVLQAIDEVQRAGYRRVKVKIAPGYDVEVLSAARTAFAGISLAADANGSYDLSEPAHRTALRALDELDLCYLEQPLSAEDLLGSAELCRELDTPILLDESIASPADLELAISLGALDGVSVKPARLGGLLPARQVLERCRQLGLSAAIGGMLESGIGRAAAITLGALSGFDLPGDLGASDRYFVPDVTAPHQLVEGELLVPGGVGLGVTLEEEPFERARVRTRRFE